MDYRFLIARRYLVSRRRVTLISFITGISVAGVTLGVAALIVVLSVMNGFYDFVRDLLVSLDPHVRIVSVEDGGIRNADSLMAVALELPDVRYASAYVEGKALLVPRRGTDVNKVVIVRGVDPDAYAGVSDVVEGTGFGSFDLARRNGRPGVVAGMSLARQFALAPAAESEASSLVALLSAPALERTMANVFGGAPLMWFEVRGLFELQDVYDESHVFIALEEAQRLLRMGDVVSGVELRLGNLDRADEVKRTLSAQLDPQYYEVLTWYDLQKSLYDVMRLEKWGASFILVLIIIVAAFNIVGSLTMIVIEKRRDVGVLQAMGVSRRNIRRIFMLEGLLVGGVGTFFGLVAGLGLAWLQQRYELVPLAGAESFMISAYPISIQVLDVVAISVVAVALCSAAALYPASRAAAIEPASAVNVEG
ncbi:MAG: ABC transporter permease [Rhodothermales bacterium]